MKMFFSCIQYLKEYNPVLAFKNQNLGEKSKRNAHSETNMKL